VKILFILLFSLSSFALPDVKIGGTVFQKASAKNTKQEIKGKLVLLLKKNEKTIAKVEVVNPTLPQAFVISPRNMIERGRPFVGPFDLEAFLFDKKVLRKTNVLKAQTGTKDISLFLEN